MSKFGVGVGEEFPVDEEPRATQEDEGERCCGHGAHEARREAWRREKWRRFKRQMHAEWRARRHAMRDAFDRREDVEAVYDPHARRVHNLIVGGLAMLGLAALIGVLRHRD